MGWSVRGPAAHDAGREIGDLDERSALFAAHATHRIDSPRCAAAHDAVGRLRGDRVAMVKGRPNVRRTPLILSR